MIFLNLQQRRYLNSEPVYQARFEALQCCVLIPTYNNQATLKRVIDDVLGFTTNIIVVNDGSTDATANILSKYTDLYTINIDSNRGKGNALKAGFAAARELGYKYAISMDSDGQHYPDDLDVFLIALEEHVLSNDPELLIIGSRKMDDPSVPQKSSIGNRFSSFWYWVETGIKLQDTQCGYRLISIRSG